MDNCQSRYSRLTASCHRFRDAKQAISGNTWLLPVGHGPPLNETEASLALFVFETTQTELYIQNK